MFARWLSVVLGLWLVISQSVLPVHTSHLAEYNDFWVGLAVISVALVASRFGGVRFLNTGLGAWLVVAPVLLRYAAPASIANDIVVGVMLIGLSLVPNDARVALEARDRRPA